MDFIKFLMIYAPIENLSFIGYFTVLDVMSLKLLCKECSNIFGDDV